MPEQTQQNIGIIEKVTEHRFHALALAFQIVSLFASYEGIKQLFLAEPVLAGIFAGAINISLLFCWHEFQLKINERNNDGLTKRRSISLILGMVLLILSASLSSIGMYSYLGFKLGTETDTTAEYSQTIQQTKEVFNKVKDLASKKLDDQKLTMTKKQDSLNKRISFIKLEKNKGSIKVELKQVEDKLNEVNEKRTKLDELKPNSDEQLSLQQRNLAIQNQIANLISGYGLDRNTILTADEKKLLSYDQAVNRNLFDQFWADIQNHRPLALLGIIFGIAPDLIAIGIMFVGTPRKKFWLRIRNSKKWVVEVWHEVLAGVELPITTAVEVVVENEASQPLMQIFVPIDLTGEVSEEHFREFFPQIVSELRDYFGREFEINGLPNNWQQLLTNNQPIPLTANEIV